MTNVLLPLLARGEIQIEGLAVNAYELLGKAFVDAREAGPSTIGLLVYRGREWAAFDARSIDAEEAPPFGIALTQFALDREGERVLVVPDVRGEDDILAFWEVDEDDQLQVVAASAARFRTPGEFVEALPSVLAAPRDWFTMAFRDEVCSRRRDTLECVPLRCPVPCEVLRYFDGDLNRTQWTCVCPRGSSRLRQRLTPQQADLLLSERGHIETV